MGLTEIQCGCGQVLKFLSPTVHGWACQCGAEYHLVIDAYKVKSFGLLSDGHMGMNCQITEYHFEKREQS